MQVSPNQGSSWGISPAIPLVANGALAALWSFSALGGWGTRAFCGMDGAQDSGCVDRIDIAAGVSAVPAAAALLIVLVSLAWPRVRRDIDRLDLSLTVSGSLWLVAETILFLLGYLAQS